MDELEVLIKTRKCLVEIQHSASIIKDMAEHISTDFPPNYKEELNKNYKIVKEIEKKISEYTYYLNRFKRLKHFYNGIGQ